MVPNPEDIEAMSEPGGAFEPGKAKPWLENCFYNLQRYLRHAWQQPKGHDRIVALADLGCLVWHLYRLSDQTKTKDPYAAWRVSGRWLKVYLAVHHAEVLDDEDKMAVCANPQCCTPFFFVCRKGQRFCSEKCAGSGNREAKRRWWKRHGKQWRKRRTKTKGKGRRT
jgi:hypothetical protein